MSDMDFLKDLDSKLTARDQAQSLIDSLPGFAVDKADAHSLQRYIDMIDAFSDAERNMGNKRWFTPYTGYPIDALPKHKAFFAAGAEYPERLFMAANRVGKSIAGAYETSCHATGEYPIWWEGRVFDEPVDCWVVGADAKSTRDTVQRELLGPPGEWGTGMIPAEAIGTFFMLQGTPQAVDTVKIRHKTGKWSTIGFKNYQQELKAFYGTSRHVVWLDEECPAEVYNECNIRTATTNGIMLVTFTPLHGITPLVVNFCSNADFLVGARPFVSADQDLEDDDEDEKKIGNIQDLHRRKAVVQAGWEDAPWLDEETKARLLEDTPLHLRAARSRGEPGMGSGNVYAVSLDDIVVKPFEIPQHWKRMYALDVGWNRTACLWGAFDPESDCLYIYDEHYMGEQHPSIHASAIRSRGEWMRGVIDPASRGRSQGDGAQLLHTYKREQGLKISLAKNAFEPGIQQVHQRLAAGKLKIFSNVINLQKEYNVYRRNLKGAVLKEKDHLLDCLRYIVLNSEKASTKGQFTINREIYNVTKYDI